MENRTEYTPEEIRQILINDFEQLSGDPDVRGKIVAAFERLQAESRTARGEALEESRLAYEGHTHGAGSTAEDRDRCAYCGKDLRDKIHFRSGETKESRIRELKHKDTTNG